MPRLDLRICGARNLHNTQFFGKIDPYCTVALEGKQWRTSVAQNTLNPEWNQVFKFHVSDENSARLHFVIWDNNLLSDDFLGEYYLAIAGLQRGLVRDEWVLLQNSKSNAELHIRIMAVDYGGIPDQDLTPPHPEYRQPGRPGAYPPQQGGYPPQQQQYPPQQQQSYGGYAPQPSYPTYESREGHHHHGHGHGHRHDYGAIQEFFGRPVVIKTHHGTFLRAHPGFEARVDTQTYAGDYERFHIEPRDNGHFVIRTHHGTYLQALPGGEGVTIRTSPNPNGEWERWFAEPMRHHHHFHFRSHFGTRIRAWPGGEGSNVDQKAESPAEWETFKVEFA